MERERERKDFKSVSFSIGRNFYFMNKIFLHAHEH